MTSLFHQRRALERRHNVKLLRSIVDWTVAIYLLVPTIIVGFFLYKDFATHVQTLWVAQLPFIVYIILLFFITRIETIRTYLQPADRLFLIQRENKLIQLKRSGLYWTLLKHLTILVMFLSLLAPIFLKVFHVSVTSYFLLLLLLLTFNYCHAVICLRLHQKWQQLLCTFVVRFIGILLFSYAAHVVIAISCVIAFIVSTKFYTFHYIQSTKHFIQQVERDEAVFYKWQRILFQISPELNSQIVPQMKKPRLFWRNSKRMFRRSDFFLEELVCKTIWRQKQYCIGYLRLLTMAFGLMMIVPVWAKFVVLVMLYFILKSLMQSIIQQILEHKIWTIFQASKMQIHLATLRLIRGFVHFPLLCFLVLMLLFSF